ncbi:hypothetical protein PR048_015204 [Dryococelus australis]|uniref:Uncharacterized protein n=1 Tax=Dryococelus australis TaxID=614101 RepID=A0ABQ9HGA7_9NEOP|nr:hypothetical protein PR048_015204 [Dryococelus australis]
MRCSSHRPHAPVLRGPALCGVTHLEPPLPQVDVLDASMPLSPGKPGMIDSCETCLASQRPSAGITTLSAILHLEKGLRPFKYKPQLDCPHPWPVVVLSHVLTTTYTFSGECHHGLIVAGPWPASNLAVDEPLNPTYLPTYQHISSAFNMAGCRSAAVNLEARSAVGWGTSRHCVVARLEDITSDKFREIRSRAGALLIILPRNLFFLSQEEKQVSWDVVHGFINGDPVGRALKSAHFTLNSLHLHYPHRKSITPRHVEGCGSSCLTLPPCGYFFGPTHYIARGVVPPPFPHPPAGAIGRPRNRSPASVEYWSFGFRLGTKSGMASTILRLGGTALTCIPGRLVACGGRWTCCDIGGDALGLPPGPGVQEVLDDTNTGNYWRMSARSVLQHHECGEDPARADGSFYIRSAVKVQDILAFQGLCRNIYTLSWLTLVLVEGGGGVRSSGLWELEEAMLYQEANIPVYFAEWAPNLQTIVNDIASSYMKDDRSTTAVEVLVNSIAANGYQIVMSTSQPSPRSDVNIATIQVRLWEHGLIGQALSRGTLWCQSNWVGLVLAGLTSHVGGGLEKLPLLTEGQVVSSILLRLCPGETLWVWIEPWPEHAATTILMTSVGRARDRFAKRSTAVAVVKVRVKVRGEKNPRRRHAIQGSGSRLCQL